MSIQKLECFTLDCDRCGRLFEAPFTGFSIFADKEYAKQEAVEDGDWHLDENNDKYYCDTCHSVDEDDNVTIYPPIEQHAF